MNYYLDTNIFLYAGDSTSDLHTSSRRLLEAVADGKITAFTSTETFQEIIYVGQKEKRLSHALQIFDEAFIIIDVVLPIGRAEISKLRILAQQYPTVEGRDLLHAAAALNADIPYIVSYDTDFNHIKDIQRIPPETLLEILEG